MDLSLLRDPEGIAAHNGLGRDLALPDKERSASQARKKGCQLAAIYI